MELSATDFAYASPRQRFPPIPFVPRNTRVFLFLFQRRKRVLDCRFFQTTAVNDVIRLHLLVSLRSSRCTQREKHGKVVIEFSIRNIYIYILERIEFNFDFTFGLEIKLER